MGWLSDFKKGFESGHESGSQSGARTTERLSKQLEYDRQRREAERQRLENLRYASDGELFKKFNSSSTPYSEKELISDILLSRGYYQNSNGTFNRY